MSIRDHLGNIIAGSGGNTTAISSNYWYCYQGVTQVFPDVTGTTYAIYKVFFQTLDINPGLHLYNAYGPTPATSNTNFTVPATGFYSINVNVAFETVNYAINDSIEINMYDRNDGIIDTWLSTAASDYAPVVGGTKYIKLTAGEVVYIGLRYIKTTSGDIETNNDNRRTFLQIVRLGD